MEAFASLLKTIEGKVDGAEVKNVYGALYQMHHKDYTEEEQVGFLLNYLGVHHLERGDLDQAARYAVQSFHTQGEEGRIHPYPLVHEILCKKRGWPLTKKSRQIVDLQSF